MKERKEYGIKPQNRDTQKMIRLESWVNFGKNSSHEDKIIKYKKKETTKLTLKATDKKNQIVYTLNSSFNL